MKISIITINYNNLEGLQKTVSSVLDQTYSDIEYIIIDGNSNDGSADYIEERRSSFSYWVSEADKGIYNAMNKAIVKATGTYLLFLNSGDWLVDNTVIEDFVAFKPNEPFVYGDLIKFYAENNTELSNNGGKIDFSLSDLLFGNLNHQSTFIQKEMFDKYGFYNEELKIVSDWEMFLKAIGLNGEKVNYINRKISFFDMDGICSTNKTLRDKERRLVIEKSIPSQILNDYDTLLEIRQKAGALDLIKKNKLLWFLVRSYNKLFKVYP